MIEPNKSDNRPIEPSSFQPLGDDTVSSSSPSHRVQRIAVAAGVFLFLLALLFLWQARSVTIEVESSTGPDIDMEGLAIPLGSRFLALPGTYTVSISAPGYFDLQTDIAISDEATQQFQIPLVPLPGRVAITTEPAGAQITVNDEAAGLTPAELALSPGEYSIELSAPGYLHSEHSVNVYGRDKLQTLRVSLTSALAFIEIDSKPRGAAILLGEDVVGTTPASIEVLQGKHTLQLKKAGFADWQKPLDVTAGQDIDLGLIELGPANGSVDLNSEPSGASVVLNGVFLGQTPLSVQLEPETEHVLAVSKPGFQRRTETLQIERGSDNELNFVLTPQLGRLDFALQPDSATVSVAGKRYAAGTRSLSLPAVAQDIVISAPGYVSQRRTITPRPGIPQRVTVKLLTSEQARQQRLKPVIVTAAGQSLRLFDPVAQGSFEFAIGSSRREPGRRGNENLRSIKLTRAFYLASGEVTNAEFRRYQPDHSSGRISGRTLNGDKQPVVDVSWQQAASYCNWLSRQEGLPVFYREERGIVTGFNPEATGYRLPSEAEWSYGARVSDTGLLKFPWGETFPPVKAVENYADRDSAFVTGRVLQNYDDNFAVSAPVGSFPANHNGLYDMGGNVSEWIHDVYTVPVAGEPVLTDPLGEQRGDNYVIRGASWNQARLPYLRLSYRDYGQAGRDDVGFRLARYAE